MDDSISSEDRAIVQLETLETLMVWFNQSFQERLAEEDGRGEAHNTLGHDNLADGYLLYRAAALLSPEHFPRDDGAKKLLEAFAPGSDGAVGNASQMWIKRSSLLKAFSNGLIEFFLDVAHMDVEAHLSDHVDIVQVAKNDEMTGKVELMKLLLAASINSKDKQTFIEIIMGMEDDKQEQLMYVIQEFSAIATPIDDEEEGDHDDAGEGGDNDEARSNDGGGGAGNTGGEGGRGAGQSPSSADAERRPSFASSIASDDSEDSQKMGSGGQAKKGYQASKQSTAAFNIVKHELEDLKAQYSTLSEKHGALSEKYASLQSQVRNNKAKEAAMKAEALNAEHTQELERLLERAEQNLMEVRATSAGKYNTKTYAPLQNPR